MNAQVSYLLGLAMDYIQKGNLKDTERLLKQALKMAPKSSEIYRLLGVNCAFKKDLNRALEMFNQAIKIEPNNWLAHSNKGNVLKDLNRHGDALKSYDRAIALQPDYAEVYNNRGNLFQELNQPHRAVESYDRAIALQPNYVDAYHGRGNAFKKMGDLLTAINCYDEARNLEPNSGGMLVSYIAAKIQICDWDGLAHLVDNLVILVANSPRQIHPFHLLSICDDPALLLKLTQKYMVFHHPIQEALGPIGPRAIGKKIRLGYFSPDFRNHAVSFLIAGVIEAHDQDRFELIAFSMGQNEDDEMRSRLKNIFNQFIDISSMSDMEVAALSRELTIDIAIDLGGLTQDARPGIFSYRAAPVQVGYLGFLGTMATPYMDYIVADKVIIPPELQGAYSEKVMYLPSYQANDPKRVISEKIFTRAELGLPSHGFIYCCFNNNFKFSAAILDSWALILKSVEGSVIFLYAENSMVRKNLLAEFEARGIENNRIIFAERIPRDEYLARYRVADLFLDTSPYNAGTTASDALWVGLPVVTFTGNSFSSRMGASILNSIELPEMVADSQKSYEALAIDLGNNPNKIQIIKTKLMKNRLTAPLFNTELFTRNLELSYEKVHQRYIDGLPPQHIS